MSNEPGPFDRILESGSPQDRTARLVFIGMGGIGLIILALVLLPIPFLGGGGKKNNEASTGNQTSSQAARGAAGLKGP